MRGFNCKTASISMDAVDWEVLTLEETFDHPKLFTDRISADDFIAISKKCRKRKDLDKAHRLLLLIHTNGLDGHTSLGNHIVPMLVDCGSISSAQEVFNGLRYRNVHTWTSLIAGYAQHSSFQHAYVLYGEMQARRVQPNSYVLVTLLKACLNLMDVQAIHREIVEEGFDRDVFVGSTLVYCYVQCGALLEAREVFDKLSSRNVVSWTALIAGYTDNGCCQEALNCYELMQLQGLPTNDVTLLCLLKACGSLRAIVMGQEVHTEATQKGFVENPLLGSTLLDMYAKCGSLVDAQAVFDKLSVRDVVSWNALIGGYVEHGCGHEALICFEQMQDDYVCVDAFTVVYVLKACGIVGALDEGLEMHTEITWKFLDNDIFVGNALIDMYAQCGSITEARKVFNGLQVKDVVSWNAMLRGYSVNYEGTRAIELFDCMRGQCVKPDSITFTSVLSACSHCNLPQKGVDFFKLMISYYGIASTLDHFTCLVDLLARSGKLYEAEKLLEIMTGPLLKEMWLALMSACKSCSEFELGSRCFQHLIKIDPECSTPYMLMANMYGNVNWQENAQEGI